MFSATKFALAAMLASVHVAEHAADGANTTTKAAAAPATTTPAEPATAKSTQPAGPYNCQKVFNQKPYAADVSGIALKNYTAPDMLTCNASNPGRAVFSFDPFAAAPAPDGSAGYYMTASCDGDAGSMCDFLSRGQGDCCVTDNTGVPGRPGYRYCATACRTSQEWAALAATSAAKCTTPCRALTTAVTAAPTAAPAFLRKAIMFTANVDGMQQADCKDTNLMLALAASIMGKIVVYSEPTLTMQDVLSNTAACPVVNATYAVGVEVVFKTATDMGNLDRTVAGLNNGFEIGKVGGMRLDFEVEGKARFAMVTEPAVVDCKGSGCPASGAAQTSVVYDCPRVQAVHAGSVVPGPSAVSGLLIVEGIGRDTCRAKSGEGSVKGYAIMEVVAFDDTTNAEGARVPMLASDGTAGYTAFASCEEYSRTGAELTCAFFGMEPGDCCSMKGYNKARKPSYYACASQCRTSAEWTAAAHSLATTCTEPCEQNFAYNPDDDDLSTGAIVGIVVGVLVILIVLGVVVAAMAGGGRKDGKVAATGTPAAAEAELEKGAEKASVPAAATEEVGAAPAKKGGAKVLPPIARTSAADNSA